MFVENRGQWVSPLAFIAQRGGWYVGVDAGTVVMARSAQVNDTRVRGAVVRLSFGEASSAPPMGVGARPERRHYLLRGDPAGWRTDVAAYDAVRLPLAEGAACIVTWCADGPRLEWHVPAGGAGSAIDVRCEGVDGLSLDEDGSLLMATPVGLLRHLVPGAQQQLAPDGSGELEACFRVLAPDCFDVSVAGRDATRDLVVSSGLQWSTFLGGSESGASVQSLALTGDGGVTVCGRVNGDDFPVTPGAFDLTYAGGSGFTASDLYVAHLDSFGSELEWATFLGGSINEDGHAMILDADGVAIIAGQTTSPDWPTTSGVYQETKPSLGSSGFVTALAADGASLMFSTYFGGSTIDMVQNVTIDIIHDLARDPNGNLVVVGSTQSMDFPVTQNAFQPTGGGFLQDAFVAVLGEDGSEVIYASYLGGAEGGDSASAVAVADTGLVYLVGTSSSEDFPVTPGAYQEALLGFIGGDVFVSCVDLGIGALVASTYLGSDTSDGAVDVALDPDGRVVVMGVTNGFNPPFPTFVFPTTPNAYDATYNGFEDIFVSKLSPDLGTLEYSTFIGGVDRDFAHAMVVEPSGAVVILGDSESVDFPTTLGCVQPLKSNPLSDTPDLVVFRLSPAGDALHYSTFFGGMETEGSGAGGDAALAVDAAGAATIGSFSVSDDFPTTPGSYKPTKDPEDPAQAVLARLSLLPSGVESFGTSTPGCGGPLTMGVASWPAVGESGFTLTCSGAPASSVGGIFAVGAAPLATPMTAAGADLWIEPAGLLLFPGLKSGPTGFFQARAPIPADPTLAGQSLAVQCFWPDACAPAGFASSNALLVTVQP